jgi:hypothetical protein
VVQEQLASNAFATAKPDARLIKLLIRAHRFNSILIGSAGMPFAALARQEGVSRSFRSRSRCGPCSRRPKQNSPPQHPPKRRGSQVTIGCDPVHKGGATKKRERQSYSTLTLKVCGRCVRRPSAGSTFPLSGVFYLNAIIIPSAEAMKPRRSSRCDGAIAL